MDKIKVGEKYGRLTVLENHHPKYEIICKCDCGVIKAFVPHDVFCGKTQSCGCLHKEMVKNMKYKHGESHTRLYKIWRSMLNRCQDKKAVGYFHYGGRGIIVCEEWQDYMTFKQWALANDYDKDLTIDRINPNGNYEPGNCRWVTWKVQANNKRNTTWLTLGKKTHSIHEWSDILNIHVNTLRWRKEHGWSDEEALTIPAGTIRSYKKCKQKCETSGS